MVHLIDTVVSWAELARADFPKGPGPLRYPNPLEQQEAG